MLQVIAVRHWPELKCVAEGARLHWLPTAVGLASKQGYRGSLA